MGKAYLKSFIIKILFLTDNFPPEFNAPASRTFDHCSIWAKQNTQVTVITCFPNFPKGKVFDGYKNKLWSKEIINDIEVIRVWTYITENSGFIKRTLDYISFGIAAIFASLIIKTDLIIATSPHFFTALSGMIISKIKRKKWILEVRDLWPESILAVEAIKNKKIIGFLQYLEMLCYNSCSKIICVTNSFKKIIAAKGISIKKIDVIKNGVDLNKFYPRPINNKLKKKLNIDNKFVIGYVGTIGLAHGLDFILKSAKYIEDKDIHIIIMGEGANKNKLKKLLVSESITNVSIIDSVPKDEIINYLAMIDVSLINLKNSYLFKTVIPSKIFENAAMHIPILLGVDGEAREIIEEYNAGLYFEPENKMDFIKKVFSIKNNQNLFDEYKNGAKKLALKYNRETLALSMLKIIKTNFREQN